MASIESISEKLSQSFGSGYLPWSRQMVSGYPSLVCSGLVSGVSVASVFYATEKVSPMWQNLRIKILGGRTEGSNLLWGKWGGSKVARTNNISVAVLLDGFRDKILHLLPMPPDEGPPLPRKMGIKWPGKTSKRS